ncbi:MAG TPA: proline racemase family protein [Steroidobacteraceae bacterium]|jgi:proline racemase|nr:proline racemase family protein [Steroidobacteraceae bacterium]
MRLQQVITVVGVHAEGEVGRVITGGVIAPRAASMFERQQLLQSEQDCLRLMLLSDPRGSVNTAVNLVTPPISPEADIGLIVMESDYYPPMSGSNLMCTVTAVLETGMLRMTEPLTRICVDTPAGLVRVEAECSGGKCRRVAFRNVPAFVMHGRKAVSVPGLGTITVDVAYGGMIYVLVEAQAPDFALVPAEARALVELGERIKQAAAAQLPAIHPGNPGIHTINQTLFAGPLRVENGVKTARNAVVVSPGRIDRSPCGTGSSARMAVMSAHGDLAVDEPFRHVSILGTEFDCGIEATTSVGGIDAVITRVVGRAWLTGVSYYGVDPEDPFPEGYRLNDTWLSC